MDIKQLEDNQRRLRREVLIRRVLHTLERTVRLRPITPDARVEDVYIEFTNESASVVGQLVEAVEILEAIIWASDGCMGHKHCIHSMEPWERARALLQGKWEAETGERRVWPDPNNDR
jgi:hypothetical protein